MDSLSEELLDRIELDIEGGGESERGTLKSGIYISTEREK